MHDVTGRSATPGAAGAPGGRRWVVMLAGLVVCGGVYAAVSLTGDRNSKPPGELSGASASVTPVLGSPSSPAADATSLPALAPEAIDYQVKSVLKKVEELDRTIWAQEVEAQRYEEYFIRVWDRFRAADDKLRVLQDAAFDTMTFGTPGQTTAHDWDVKVIKFEGADRSLDSSRWQSLLAGLRAEGYEPTELEFHQSSFEHPPGRPATSLVSTVVHVVNENASSRHALRTKLKVQWAETPGPDGVFAPHSIEATDLVLTQRVGDVAFRPKVLPGGKVGGLPAAENSTYILVYDLDGDGLAEILIPGENLLLRNRGGWRFERELILADHAQGLEGGVIADFNGDALPDLLCNKGDHIYLVLGAKGGRFAIAPPERVAPLDFPVRTITAFTAGDVDGDGDLDAWFGQYKRPYVGGQMPTPYYDANDGYPAALLINDGTGRFTDATQTAGLASKRHRRTFAASLVDLDADRDLDLLVNSDFAGLDVYYNEGDGRFADVSDQVIKDRHNFGMGHTFADFNLDGRLDMYTIGMSSTTARRLTSMGLGLDAFPEYQAKRPQMGYGNRMFLAPAGLDGLAPGQAPAAYVQPAYRDDLARTGWSYGTAAPDVDNDGDPDIYVANGHVSGQTCRDYCTTYWRRDIYLASSKEDPVMKNVLGKHGMDPKDSWNGFEHDVLFINEGGKGYLNVAHLMGVAFEFDGRNVISDDFDGDGKMDLLVVEKQSPRGRNIHVYKNEWPTTNNWIGIRLAETRPGFSPLGADVRIRTDKGLQVARIVTGDSFMSQHATARHFGLGEHDKVESVEVTWPNGFITRVANPAVNQWHSIKPAGRPAAVSSALVR